MIPFTLFWDIKISVAGFTSKESILRIATLDSMLYSLIESTSSPKNSTVKGLDSSIGNISNLSP